MENENNIIKNHSYLNSSMDTKFLMKNLHMEMI